MLDSLKCFVVEKRDFMSTSTHILESVCNPVTVIYSLRYVVGQHQGQRIALPNFTN